MNRPSNARCVETRSRVTPGMSCTMLMRLPTRALRRLLLPTLGRPTIATTGLFAVMPPLNGSLRKCAMRGLAIVGGSATGGLLFFMALQLGLENAADRNHPRWARFVPLPEGEE